MFNYQSIAVRIEHALQSHGYAAMGDADAIRSNPMAFMDAVLKRYEKSRKRMIRNRLTSGKCTRIMRAVALMNLVKRWPTISQMMLLTCSNKAKAGA